MHVTLTALMRMFEENMYAELCSETPYYAQNPEQTKKSWFMKRANHPDEYGSLTVQNMFKAFKLGYQAAGGTVDEQA